MKKSEAIELVKNIKQTTEDFNNTNIILKVIDIWSSSKKCPNVNLRFYQTNYNIWGINDIKHVGKILNENNVDWEDVGFMMVDGEGNLYFDIDIYYDIEEGE